MWGNLFADTVQAGTLGGALVQIKLRSGAQEYTFTMHRQTAESLVKDMSLLMPREAPTNPA